MTYASKLSPDDGQEIADGASAKPVARIESS
jgi:hypothetical protein